MRRSGLTLVDVVVGVIVVLVAGLLLLVAEAASHNHSHRGRNATKCSNNLKQIGMAAIQYMDDKRFFPHLAKQKELQGGWKTNTATRICRALTYYNYNDNPETYICPDAADQFVPLSQAARVDIRAFRWNGAEGPPTEPPPMFAGAASDVPLCDSTDLSYGWTRRGLSGVSMSTMPLAGDKSRIVADLENAPPAVRAAHKDNMIGNHREALLVVCVDAHTIRVTPSSSKVNTKTISATEGPDAGFLGVLGDDPELGQ